MGRKIPLLDPPPPPRLLFPPPIRRPRHCRLSNGKGSLPKKKAKKESQGYRALFFLSLPFSRVLESRENSCTHVYYTEGSIVNYLRKLGGMSFSSSSSSPILISLFPLDPPRKTREIRLCCNSSCTKPDDI